MLHLHLITSLPLRCEILSKVVRTPGPNTLRVGIRICGVLSTHLFSNGGSSSSSSSSSMRITTTTMIIVILTLLLLLLIFIIIIITFSETTFSALAPRASSPTLSRLKHEQLNTSKILTSLASPDPQPPVFATTSC